MKFTKEAQDIINRLERVMQEQPRFNLEEVTKCFEEQYRLLNVPMPKIEVAKDMVLGYEIARVAAWGVAWGAARDAARGVAWGAARDAARDAAWDAVWDAAWGAARVAAWVAAWGAARGAARDAAWGAARGAAWDAVWDAAAANVDLDDERIVRYIQIETQMLKALEHGLGFYFPMKDKLILVPFPKMRVDERKRLHSLEKPAVDWKGGAKFYFVHGVRISKRLWEKITTNSCTKEDWISEENLEIRRIIQESMRERFVTEIGGKVVGKHKDPRIGEIVEIDISPDPEKIAHYLHAKDWSTERMYFLRIPPTITDPIEAQKWTYDDNNVMKVKYRT